MELDRDDLRQDIIVSARLEGRDMGAVMGWALRPTDRAPATILRAQPGRVPPGWLDTLEANLTAAPATRSGYFAAVIPAVSGSLTAVSSSIVASST